MSVLLETSLGDVVIDLFTDEAPMACFNFIQLCQMKFYNSSLFHGVQKDYIAESGRSYLNKGDHTIWSLLGQDKKYFSDEISRRKFRSKGIVATGNTGPNLNNSTFFMTLTDEPLDSFYKKHTIFG